MRKKAVIGITVALLGIMWVPAVRGEESAVSAAGGSAAESLISDHQALRKSFHDLRQELRQAHQEQRDIRLQIREAVAAGDGATAEALRSELQAMHAENRQLFQSRRDELKEQGQDLRAQFRDAVENGEIDKQTAARIQRKFRQRRKQYRDRREDFLDRRHHRGPHDRIEDYYDRREDRYDRGFRPGRRF